MAADRKCNELLQEQFYLMFKGIVAGKIYGDDDTCRKLFDAAVKLTIPEFPNNPGGLAYRIEDNGRNLSGGESETVGGYSRTLATGGESALSALNATDGAKKLLAETCREYLAHTGLLYRGGGCRCTLPTL